MLGSISRSLLTTGAIFSHWRTLSRRGRWQTPPRAAKHSFPAFKAAGVPVGSPVFVRAQLSDLLLKHQHSHTQLALMDQVQVAYLILCYCVAVRLLYRPRNFSPSVLGPLGTRSDELTLRTFAALIGRRVADLPSSIGPIIALPSKRGGGTLSSAPLLAPSISLARQSFSHFSQSITPFTYLVRLAWTPT